MADITLEVEATPATPGTSKATVYVDSTTTRLASKNAAGTVSDYADLTSTQSMAGKTLTSPTITGMSATTATVNGSTLLTNSNSGSQSLATADTYVTGSALAMPAAKMAQGSWFRWVFAVTKNATGTSTPIVNVRFGTGGTTSDSARLTFTFAATTAATDAAVIELWVQCVAIGGSGSLQGTCRLIKQNTTNTGFSAATAGTQVQILNVTSGSFDTTVANSILGVSINPGTGTYTVLTAIGDAGKI